MDKEQIEEAMRIYNKLLQEAIADTGEEILKEFDKKSEKRCLDISVNGAELWCKEKTAKNFIAEKFETYFEKRLKEILPEKLGKKMTEQEPTRNEIAYQNGYNQCLEDILTNNK